jgi:myo-inositol-1(or 4)-monophosphatase
MTEDGALIMSTVEGRWLACAAHMARAGKEAALPLHGTPAGRVLLGRGAGGDRTMEIDNACEIVMHRVLAAEAPGPYGLVSEESGVSGPADAPWKVVVDPLDGSLNAKRGLEPFCASIAVADGPLLRDIKVAYIEDYVRPHAFATIKGSGLLRLLSTPSPVDRQVSTPADPDLRFTAIPRETDASRFATDVVEVVLLEAGRPDRHHFRYQDLSAMGATGRSQDMRIRQIGSLALSLCYVAVGIADILVAAVRSRSVDIAAGLLILQEAGGGAATFDGDDILLQPLDLDKRCGFVAWRSGLDAREVLRHARVLGPSLVGS